MHELGIDAYLVWSQRKFDGLYADRPGGRERGGVGGTFRGSGPARNNLQSRRKVVLLWHAVRVERGERIKPALLAVSACHGGNRQGHSRQAPFAIRLESNLMIVKDDAAHVEVTKQPLNLPLPTTPQSSHDTAVARAKYVVGNRS